MYFWNSWAAVFGLFLAFSFNVLHVQGVWVNDWEQPVNFACENFEFLRGIISYHDNGVEDRKFFLQCGKLPIILGTSTSTPICSWTEEVNEFQEDFLYTCNGTRYMAGIQSRHDNNHEDRRYKLYCCYMPDTAIFGCDTPQEYVNGYDEVAAYVVPDDKILNGMSSIYDSRGGDRRFKFISCSMSCH